MATALHGAVQARDLEGVRTLLAEGLDIEAKDRLERTPLFHAASRCHADIVDALLDAGADPNAADLGGVTPLMTAFQWNTHFTTVWGMGPTHIPAANNPQSYRLISSLVARGADLNQADVAGRVALHYAAAKLDDQGVALLAELGADLTVRDEQGYAASWTAIDAYAETWVTSGDNFKTATDRILQIVP